MIIARFLPEIHAICKLLEKRNVAYACIYGAIKDRQEQVNRFQNDHACMVFVGQIAIAGLGITLTAASIMVFYSLDYSMSNFEQTKARIHRAGQKNECTYLYLTAKGTVDTRILAALRNKADLAKLLIDDYRKGLNPFAEEGGESYEDLANAIVLQAVADYRRAMRKLNKNPDYGPALYTKREVERFFRSCWYAEITSVDPTLLLSELKQEAL